MVLNSPFTKILYIDLPPRLLWSSLSERSEMLPLGLWKTNSECYFSFFIFFSRKQKSSPDFSHAVLTLLSPILFSHLHSSLVNQKFLIIMKIQSLMSIEGSRMGLNLLQTPFAKKCHYLTYSVIFWNIPSEISLIDIRDNPVWIGFFWGGIY